jgi:3-hydroxybutyryl-CoA dehydrogenase
VPPKFTIGVLGGGLMGAGITHVFAGSGYPVRVFEPLREARESLRQRVRAALASFQQDEALADNVTPCEDLGETVAQTDYVTEAAPEKLEIKRAIFADLVRLTSPSAILASNTSVIPIHLIAEGLPTAERIIGTHWWNPAALIPLVEVVQSARTSIATVRITMELLASVGKSPAHIHKDVPGFVANRLQHALWREAIAMVAEGICDAATLDACVKNSFGLRLPVLGPLENADLVGLDLTLDIHKTIIPELNSLPRPNPFLESKVAAGQLGFKTGEGFRTWTPEEIRILRERLAAHLLKARQERVGA